MFELTCWWFNWWFNCWWFEAPEILLATVITSELPTSTQSPTQSLTQSLRNHGTHRGFDCSCWLRRFVPQAWNKFCMAQQGATMPVWESIRSGNIKFWFTKESKSGDFQEFSGNSNCSFQRSLPHLSSSILAKRGSSMPSANLDISTYKSADMAASSVGTADCAVKWSTLQKVSRKLQMEGMFCSTHSWDAGCTVGFRPSV